LEKLKKISRSNDTKSYGEKEKGKENNVLE
jgi:hypothetical protein